MNWLAAARQTRARGVMANAAGGLLLRENKENGTREALTIMASLMSIRLVVNQCAAEIYIGEA